jgi:hypothetical protein
LALTFQNPDRFHLSGFAIQHGRLGITDITMAAIAPLWATFDVQSDKARKKLSKRTKVLLNTNGRQYLFR